MYLQSYNASRPWLRLCNLTKKPRLTFPSLNEGKPVVINLQRLSVVDEYKDIIINDVKYSLLLTLFPPQPLTTFFLIKQHFK